VNHEAKLGHDRLGFDTAAGRDFPPPEADCMHQLQTAIDEIMRLPAPCPNPIGLACDGPQLWLASPDTNRLYGLNAQQGTVFEEAEVPGTPYGMTVVGDTLRMVVGHTETDDRSVYRYIMGRHFKESEVLPCPDNSGSFLAYDGECLFLSQRSAKRIVELDEAGAIVSTIAVPREITGMVIVDGMFFVVTTENRNVDDYRLLQIDNRGDEPAITELASIPFPARSLAWDGSRFWTSARGQNTLVAFARPT
jgi:hypothetical protein